MLMPAVGIKRQSEGKLISLTVITEIQVGIPHRTRIHGEVHRKRRKQKSSIFVMLIS